MIFVLQLPASFYAYRKQQHRWTCGPVALWKKTAITIIKSKISWIRKMEICLVIFCVQKFLCHWVNFGFFCVLVPLSVFTPEVCATFSEASCRATEHESGN
jgi:beta-mannan synthase